MKVDKIIRFVCIVKGRLRFFFWFLFSFILLSFLTVILEKPVLATDYIGSVGRYKDPDPAPYCGIQKINFNNHNRSPDTCPGLVFSSGFDMGQQCHKF